MFKRARNLAGKVVVITGGSLGIGRPPAQAFRHGRSGTPRAARHPHPGGVAVSNRGAILRGHSPALFSSSVIDHIVHVHPAVAVALYAPVVAATTIFSLDQAGPLALVGWAGGGYLTWTLVEYWGHRLLFHFEPEEGWGARFHHIIHGVHHEYPQDPRRTIMSPLLSLPLVATALVLPIGVFGLPAVFAAGFVSGYLAYDLVHLYVHHARPRSGPMKRLHELHMRHHFRDDTRGFGVSAPYWDHVFGTSITRASRATR
jgi:sterol desaturase/sphingolipid hydroxylase (fatty acid hydroxylase superfamily)